jgi:hypothetical protein
MMAQRHTGPLAARLGTTRKLALLLPLLLAGCASGRYSRLPDPVPEPFKRDPLDRVVMQMDERRNSVETLVAKVNIVLKDNTRKDAKEQSLNGYYLGNQNGDMRLRVKYGEDTLVLDLSIHENTVELWLPRKDRFYRGSRKEVAEATGNELALLAQIGSVQDLFFPRAWTEQATERRYKHEDGVEAVYVIERHGLIRRKVRRLEIADDQPVVRVIKVMDRQERPVGSVAYDDWRFPGPRAGGPPGAKLSAPYPGHLTLTSSDGRRSLHMEVEELSLNEDAPLRTEQFEIKLPKPDPETESPMTQGTKILDLGAVLRSGKSLWE